MLNQNIMFTAFRVFCDKSPGTMRKDLCDWINSNLDMFKQQCVIGMATKDIDFDEWFTNLKSDETVCDEFGLSGLCQAFQQNALVVTSTKTWTTIPSTYGKTIDEVRRLCDVHFLFMCQDTYCCLKPKFLWKCEFPIGELELIPAQSESTGPLVNITEKMLDRESNKSNIVKEEVPTDTEAMPSDQATEQDLPDDLGLIQVPALPSTNVELPDATQNLLMSLPVETYKEFMDATMTEEHETLAEECETTRGQAVTQCELPKTILCSINLTDISASLVDGVLVVPSSQVPLEPKVIVETKQYDLRERPMQSRGSTRPKRKASSNINYGLMDVISEEEELIISDSEQMNIPAKSAPSGYRLATHKYMLAKW